MHKILPTNIHVRFFANLIALYGTFYCLEFEHSSRNYIIQNMSYYVHIDIYFILTIY